MDTLNNIEDVGRQEVGHLCQDGSYVLTAYDKFASVECKKDEDDTRSSAPLFIRKLRQFRDACAKGLGKRRKNSQTPALSLPQTNKASRFSERLMNNVTPAKTPDATLKEYNGHHGRGRGQLSVTVRN